MPTMRRSQIKEMAISFFESEGRILTEAEWSAADKDGRAPFNVKLIGKNYHSYKKFIRMINAHEAARIAAIGTKPVIHEPAHEEPAEEEDLSPLDKLRALRGESSE